MPIDDRPKGLDTQDGLTTESRNLVPDIRPRPTTTTRTTENDNATPGRQRPDLTTDPQARGKPMQFQPRATRAGWHSWWKPESRPAAHKIAPASRNSRDAASRLSAIVENAGRDDAPGKTAWLTIRLAIELLILAAIVKALMWVLPLSLEWIRGDIATVAPRQPLEALASDPTAIFAHLKFAAGAIGLVACAIAGISLAEGSASVLRIAARIVAPEVVAKSGRIRK